MGLLLVLVSPCFRENVVFTCKIGSFLCSSDNLLQKNVIVFFFGNQISKWRSFEKRAIFDLLFTFLVTREKIQKLTHSTSLKESALIFLIFEKTSEIFLVSNECSYFSHNPCGNLQLKKCFVLKILVKPRYWTHGLRSGLNECVMLRNTNRYTNRLQLKTTIH